MHIILSFTSLLMKFSLSAYMKINVKKKKKERTFKKEKLYYLKKWH